MKFLLVAVTISVIIASAFAALALPSSSSTNYAANNTLMSGGGRNISSSSFFSQSALSQLATGNASSSSYVTGLGFFNLLNTAPSLTSVASNRSTAKYGDSIRITSSGASDDEGDTLRLECGDSSGSSNLCIGTYGSGERTCDFSSPWSDNSAHTVYCRMFDGSDSSPDKTTTITSDNAGPSIAVDYPLNATYHNDTLDLNVTASESANSCWWNLNGGTNSSMSGSGTDWDAVMTTGGQGLFRLFAYCNDSYGNLGSNSSVFFTVSLIDMEITRIIQPTLLVARTNETLYVNTTAKINRTKYEVPHINITDEIPYDFSPPSVSQVKVYFIDYLPYNVVDITGHANVNISILDQSGTLPTLLMVNISNIWQTSAGTNMTVNDSVLIYYTMISSKMEPNAYRNVYTNATAKDNRSNTKTASILKTINSSQVVLRGDKRLWIPDLSNPQLLSGEIVVKAMGGPVSGILLSDYLPQGAAISGLNVTYYNQSTGATKNLVNGSDYYLAATPTQTTLPGGVYVDVYYYNFSYRYTNWDGNLYDNDTINITYNITISGGGQWVLPAIISGFDPQYQKNIKTEMYANTNVPSFDVLLDMITKIVNPGDTVKAMLRMINVGGPKAKVDVAATYSIKTMTGELITEATDTFAVVEQKEQELSLDSPKEIKPGMYTFEAFVSYTGREAISTRTFEVAGTQAAGPSGDSTILYIIGAIAGIAAAAAILMKGKGGSRAQSAPRTL